MAESLIKEDSDLTNFDRGNIDYFNSLEQRIKDNNIRLLEIDALEKPTQDELNEANSLRA
jgi:hypothetical protein